jgi:hypothetical protein
MIKGRKLFLCWTLALSVVGITTLCTAEQKKMSEREAQKLGTEAYIYGYPLVTMEVTRRVMTNVSAPESLKAPMGQFINAQKYPNASFKDVTAPNADTLYSVAWIDLSKEPYILHVPNEHGRYYLMPMLSGWTNVIAAPGTRTTGTQEHHFAIVGPNWKGPLPKNVTQIKSPTNMVWILGRTYSTGTPEDYKTVHAIQDQYSLTPLSEYGKPYTPPEGSVDPNIDMKTPVRDQVDTMDAATFFKTLAALMKENPPAPEDAPMVAKLTKIGVIPGQDFDMSKLDPIEAKGLTAAPKAGLEKIMAHEKQAGIAKNGWLFSSKTGIYGTDYLQRALVTAVGLGANRPQDAIYPVAKTDSEGKPLNGGNYYQIHFAKGQIPPVKGFWSLTMYNKQFFFVNNALNRYTLSPRNQLKYNKDGSLDLYIQHESPGKDKESNWLPAPKDDFILMLRLYWPKEAILNGSWNPPPIKRV